MAALIVETVHATSRRRHSEMMWNQKRGGQRPPARNDSGARCQENQTAYEPASMFST
jgi:hypothetical protein